MAFVEAFDGIWWINGSCSLLSSHSLTDFLRDNSPNIVFFIFWLWPDWLQISLPTVIKLLLISCCAFFDFYQWIIRWWFFSFFSLSFGQLLIYLNLMLFVEVFFISFFKTSLKSTPCLSQLSSFLQYFFKKQMGCRLGPQGPKFPD